MNGQTRVQIPIQLWRLIGDPGPVSVSLPNILPHRVGCEDTRGGRNHVSCPELLRETAGYKCIYPFPFESSSIIMMKATLLLAVFIIQ